MCYIILYVAGIFIAKLLVSVYDNLTIYGIIVSRYRSEAIQLCILCFALTAQFFNDQIANIYGNQ